MKWKNSTNQFLSKSNLRGGVTVGVAPPFFIPREMDCYPKTNPQNFHAEGLDKQPTPILAYREGLGFIDYRRNQLPEFLGQLVLWELPYPRLDIWLNLWKTKPENLSVSVKEI